MNDWFKGAYEKGSCHTGNPLVFEINGVAVHAGGTTRSGGYKKMNPLPDLAIGPDQVLSTRGTSVPSLFKCKDHVGVNTHIISIDWPDFGIPQDVTRPFWVQLVDDIERLGIKTVSTQCVGGHGRTGVQLAILAHLMGATKQKDASSLIEWVRNRYCSHAVEGFSQQEYVAEVCQIPVGKNLFKITPKTSAFTLMDIEDDREDKKRRKKGNKFKPEPKPKDLFEEEGSLFDDYSMYICGECGDERTWITNDGMLSPTCSICECEMVDVSHVVENDKVACVECDKDVSPLSINYMGVCDLCILEEKGAKIRDGTVQCKKCKKYHIPEFMVNTADQRVECAGCLLQAERKNPPSEKEQE